MALALHKHRTMQPPSLLPIISAPLNSEAVPTLQWVEIASSLQIPSFQIIGLPSPEVAEARERIRAAIVASGFEFPRRRLILNLAPSNIRKRGTGIDLAMALAILASAVTQSDSTTGVPLFVAWGELGLDGTIKPAGQLTRTLFAAWNEHASHVLISEKEYRSAERSLECLLASGELKDEPPLLVPVGNLREAWEFLRKGKKKVTPQKKESPGKPVIRSVPPEPRSALLPLAPSLERVVGISAAGSHHLLLLGPRGTGKTHALDWLIALQPSLSPSTQLRVALLKELETSANDQETHLAEAPVRVISPHVRPSALIGRAGSLQLRPGEFSLAHGGLLIADELPEWARDSRESLREPLERGYVTITRTNGSLQFPAQFTLAANGNLCPCGGWPASLPVPREALDGPVAASQAFPACKCLPHVRQGYLSRLSGPVLDRIDLLYMVTGTTTSKNGNEQPERLAMLKDHVEHVRLRSEQVYGASPGVLAASELENLLKDFPDWKRHLDQLQIPNLRGRHKVIRIAISLGLWDGLDFPDFPHFMEASCYRSERFGLLH